MASPETASGPGMPEDVRALTARATQAGNLPGRRTHATSGYSGGKGTHNLLRRRLPRKAYSLETGGLGSKQGK